MPSRSCRLHLFTRRLHSGRRSDVSDQAGRCFWALHRSATGGLVVVSVSSLVRHRSPFLRPARRECGFTAAGSCRPRVEQASQVARRSSFSDAGTVLVGRAGARGCPSSALFRQKSTTSRLQVCPFASEPPELCSHDVGSVTPLENIWHRRLLRVAATCLRLYRVSLSIFVLCIFASEHIFCTLPT